MLGTVVESVASDSDEEQNLDFKVALPVKESKISVSYTSTSYFLPSNFSLILLKGKEKSSCWA
jgi:hypothetical protein